VVRSELRAVAAGRGAGQLPGGVQPGDDGAAGAGAVRGRHRAPVPPGAHRAPAHGQRAAARHGRLRYLHHILSAKTYTMLPIFLDQG
jgi:hypothetical protein